MLLVVLLHSSHCMHTIAGLKDVAEATVWGSLAGCVQLPGTMLQDATKLGP